MNTKKDTKNENNTTLKSMQGDTLKNLETNRKFFVDSMITYDSENDKIGFFEWRKIKYLSFYKEKYARTRMVLTEKALEKKYNSKN